jgi:regulator-associated protein of mTOR
MQGETIPRGTTQDNKTRNVKEDQKTLERQLEVAISDSVYFSDRRHAALCYNNALTAALMRDWRMRERLKTVSVVLMLCLNIGVDPPDVTKTVPAAKTQAWVDPFALPPQKALETIGRNLQAQYEVSYILR